MKKVLLMMAAMLFSAAAMAQGVQAYTMETSSEPWNSISATGTQLTYVAADGGNQNIMMPFEFPFGEATIAEGDPVCMRADGYMLLNSGTGTHNAYGYCNTSTRVIVPFLLVDGQMPQGNSGCWWQVDTADDGQRVLVVEFQHVQHYNVGTDDFNYQVRLYENGNVAVHYGHMENHASDSSFNFMMVSDAIAGYNDAIALMGSWDNPTAFHPNTMGSSSSSVPHYITGMPDSGLVVTYVRPEPPCPKPTHVRAEELEPTSCQLVWRGNGVGGCTYEVYMDTTPFNVNYPGSRPLLSTNDTVLYLDSLLPNHQYAGYIRSNCCADVSNWMSFSIYTPCVSISHAELPFTEDFEFYTGSQYRRTLFNPGCWRGDGYVTQQSGYDGHRCLFLSSGDDAQPIIVALPAIDSVSDLELTFSVQRQSGTLEVGVLDEADNLSSFVPLQTISAPTNTWSTRSVRFNTYEGTGKAIAFRVTTAASRIYIDDIDVHVAVGCPAVEMLTVSDVASTTATVGWTDPNQVGSYRVVVHPLLSSGSSATINASASPVSLTGLTPDELYVVELYSLCDSQQSVAVADTFRTLCAPKTAPFSESFENTNLSFCWTALSMRFNSASPAPDWMPEVSQAEVSSGIRSLCMPSKRINLVGREASWVVLPTMTDAPNRVMVDFDYKVSDGYEYVELAVGITTSETDTSGFVRLATIRPADGDWHRYSVNFALSGITDGRIAMLQSNHSDHSYAGGLPNEYGYLDSVVVTPFAGCMRPVALTVSMVGDAEATVSWQDVNGAGTYEVTCGTQTVTVTGDTSYTFTGLAPETTYSVSVRTVCPGGYTEALTTTFTTTCAGITDFPWSENFDSWAEGSFGSCWTRLEGPDRYSCVEVVSTTHSVRMNSDLWQGDTARSFLVLPFVAEPYAGLSLSMNVTGVSTSMSDAMLELGVMTNVTDRSSFTAFDTLPFISGISSWTYYEHALAGIGSGRLALRLTSFNGWKQVLVDDISLFYATSCARPDSLVLDSADLSSLSVRVVDPDSVGQYRLWWADGSLTDSVDFTGYVHTIVGLRHSTRYQLTAATICPSDGTLSTTIGTVGATACGIISHSELPYEEHYDNGIGLCSSFLDYCYPGNSGDRTGSSRFRGASGKALLPNVSTFGVPFFYILPEVDNLDSLALEFWLYTQLYIDNDMVTVGVMSNPADTTTFVALQTVYPLVADQWEQHHVSLGGYSGSGRHVALRFGSYDGWRWGQALDDLSLVRDLSCMAPDSVSVAAVTDTSATLVVHDPRGVGHYRLYAFGVPTDFYSDTVVVNGLYPAYDYTFQVAAVCADSVATFPVQVSLTTLCGTLSLPYNDDFERYEPYKMPPCWTLTGQASREPAVRSSSELGQMLYGSLYSGDSLVTFSTPTLRIDEEDVHVTFNVYASQRYTDEHYHSHPVPTRMQVSFLGDTMSSPLVLFDDSLAATAISSGIVMQPIEINTFDLLLGTGKFYFTFFHDTLYPSAMLIFALDSLSVYTIHHELPCRAVDSIAVDSVTLTTAVVSWVPRGPEEAWILQLFVNNSDTAITTDTPRVHLTGLNQGTDYAFIIIPLCYVAVVTDPVFFTTLACPEVTDVEVSAIAAHTATVSWTAPTEGPWIIEYGPVGFNQGFGTQMTVPSQAAGRVTYLLDSLQSETAYDLYVMTLCDEGKTSVWSPVRHFTTEVDGIENPQFSILDSQFLITPNPAHGSVTLSGLIPGATVTIRDASGRTVKTFTMQQSTSTLDITTLHAGVYFLTASTLTTTSTRKLIVR